MKPIDQLRQAFELISTAAPKLCSVHASLLGEAAGTVQAVLTALEVEAELDAKLDRHNKNPAQSAEPTPTYPPRGEASGSSRGGR